jgi:hypothetical protein
MINICLSFTHARRALTSRARSNVRIIGAGQRPAQRTESPTLHDLAEAIFPRRRDTFDEKLNAWWRYNRFIEAYPGPVLPRALRLPKARSRAELSEALCAAAYLFAIGQPKRRPIMITFD